MPREKISLNGWWDWYLPGGQKQQKMVPSSYLCVGEAVFERVVKLDVPCGKRVFLVFEGIAYDAEVSMNGVKIGRMLPYVRYEFDVTDVMITGDNWIQVVVRDITAPYGPTEGWESYGGIIRDVYIEIRDCIYIEDYQWITSFPEGFSKAVCSLKVRIRKVLERAFNGILQFNLSYRGTPVCFMEKDLQFADDVYEVSIDFDVRNPLLWSPQFPNLYDLALNITDGVRVIDEVGQKVGFREFKKIGTKFYLNGEKIILKGVCRHDMWGDAQGFTLTKEQMEQDMRMIKQMGANFVRLVHYPHNKAIVEIADRIGLMVSEEPGLWFNDLNDDLIVDSALEVMKRTILRDRNNVSVVFWLVFNECVVTDKYLSRAIKLCKELDPTRMVSGANFMNPKWTKEMFSKHGVDFYTYHPYGHYPDRFVTGGFNGEKPNISLKEVLEILDDKPVLFTEWGGWPVRHNPALFRDFLQSMIDFCRNEAPEPNLAGMSYWVWADIIQVSRDYPACEDGILTEGLVDVWRNKRENYYVLSDMFSEMEYDTVRKRRVEIAETGLGIGNQQEYTPVDISALIKDDRQEAAWKSVLKRAVEENKRQRKKMALTGPLIDEEIRFIGRMPVKIAEGRPLVLCDECRKVEIEIGMSVSEVYCFGHVSLVGGYPIRGKLGDVIAKYVFKYVDGTEKQVVLRNGLEFTASNIIWGPSRLDPVAANVDRVMKIIIDPDWEIYVVNCFRAKTEREKVLEKIVIELINPSFTPLLYGVTVRK